MVKGGSSTQKSSAQVSMPVLPFEERFEERLKLLERKVDELTVENQSLKLKISSAEGKNLKLTNKVEHLTKTVEELQLRSMNKNLIFFNIAEEPNENCKHVLKNFFRTSLKMEAETIENVFSYVDIAHRLGRSTQNNTRPILVSFTAREGVNTVRSYGKNLKNTEFRISEQLPKEIRAKQAALLPKVKTMKSLQPNVKTYLKNDKLFHDGRVVDPEFTKNPLADAPNNQVSLSYAQLSHSAIVTEQRSRFQGHAIRISSLRDAKAAWDALFQDFGIASGTHLIYAYRYVDPGSGTVIAGHSDDGEWAAGSVLSGYLDSQDHRNLFVAVSRTHGGVDLGKKRYTIIEQVMKNAVTTLSSNV